MYLSSAGVTGSSKGIKNKHPSKLIDSHFIEQKKIKKTNLKMSVLNCGSSS